MTKKKRTTGTNNDLQNTTQKTKDEPTRTLRKTRVDLRCSERVSNSCSTCNTHMAQFVSCDCTWLTGFRYHFMNYILKKWGEILRRLIFLIMWWFDHVFMQNVVEFFVCLSPSCVLCPMLAVSLNCRFLIAPFGLL